MQNSFQKKTILKHNADLEQLSAKRASALAHEVAETLFQGSRANTETLTFKLQGVLNQLRPHLDPTVLTELRNANQVMGPVAQAYGLGQLAFAQLLAAIATTTNADDNFAELLKGGKYVAYVRALLGKERTSAELRELVNEREETVSRKLRELREIGATDFRRDGREVINFLTPIAKEVAVNLFGRSEEIRTIGNRDGQQKSQHEYQSGEAVKAVFDCVLANHMKKLPSLGTKENFGLVHG